MNATVKPAPSSKRQKSSMESGKVGRRMRGTSQVRQEQNSDMEHELGDYVEDTFDDGGIAAFKHSRDINQRVLRFDPETSTNKDSILLRIDKIQAQDASDKSARKDTAPDIDAQDLESTTRLQLQRESLKLSEDVGNAQS